MNNYFQNKSGPLLYVDDDDNDLFLLRAAFKRAGIANPILSATDGQMAIDYLSGAGVFCDREKYPLPLLVLLDLKIPRKSGLEVLEWIRAQPALRSMVVILLTSSPFEGDVSRAYQAGVNSFVIKPSDIHQLSDVARRLKEWWLDCNQFDV